jgi:hypothetical protein
MKWLSYCLVKVSSYIASLQIFCISTAWWWLSPVPSSCHLLMFWFPIQNVLGSVALALVFHQSQSTLDHLQGQGRLCEQDQPPLSLDTIAITLMHINPNTHTSIWRKGSSLPAVWTITRKLSNLDYIIYDVQVRAGRAGRLLWFSLPTLSEKGVKFTIALATE